MAVRGRMIPNMLRPTAARRSDGKPSSLPTHRNYTQLTVEPYHREDIKRQTATRREQLCGLLGWLLKVVVGLALASPLIFLFTWNHLFAIDLGAVTAQSRGTRFPTQKTFTVR